MNTVQGRDYDYKLLYINGLGQEIELVGESQALSDGESLPASRRVDRLCFFFATFAAQCANNALFVMLPLVILGITKSEASLGFVAGLSTAMDALGTLVGGWLLRFVTERNLLLVSMGIRSLSLLSVPVLLASQSMTLFVATVIYSIDAVARGCADTARNTIPLQLAGREVASLRRFNATYQVVFESGAIAGPLVVGAVLYLLGLSFGNWIVVAGFAGAAVLLLGVPSVELEDRPATREPGQRQSRQARLGLYIAGLLLLTIYPLKQILPALFATSILQSEAATAWLVAAFGIGGTAGAVLFHRLHGSGTPRFWLGLGGVGAILLAIGWIPEALVPMLVAMLLFAGLNMTARLSLLSELQANLPRGREGNVIGLLRFSTNLTSMGLKFAVGILFALGSATVAFQWMTVLLVSVGAGTLWIAWRLGAAEQAMEERLVPDLVPAPVNVGQPRFAGRTPP